MLIMRIARAPVHRPQAYLPVLMGIENRLHILIHSPVFSVFPPVYKKHVAGFWKNLYPNFLEKKLKRKYFCHYTKATSEGAILLNTPDKTRYFVFATNKK